MSLNYTTLQSTVLAYSARADLSAEAPGFIRLCEGLLRRELRAQETRATLVEADRSSDGIYNLPATIQEVRAIWASDNDDQYTLENVGLHGIKTLAASSDPRYYAVSGNTIEIRGVPATDSEFEIVGLGWPVPLETTPTNDLLTYHEALYIYGTLFFLYTYTQDIELATNAYQNFSDAVRKINSFVGRKIGGGSILPAYNFGQVSTGRGY